MEPGKVVYLCWYDFGKKAESVCQGEVVDNSLYEGTQWQDYINVSFQPPHSAAPFCHHFPEDKLSLTSDNVPHDDCYLACAKRKDNTNRSNPSDAWQRVQQFKQDHWDYQHGHLDTDALDEYYNLWRDAIAAKRGLVHIYEVAFYPAVAPITSSVASVSNAVPPQPHPKKRKSKPTNSIQLSLFD